MGDHHHGRGKVAVLGQAVSLSRTPAPIEQPSPERGEHTDAILAELGYDAAAIGKLRAAKAV